MSLQRHSGPIKTEYKSPHTVMTLRRSGFLPTSVSPHHYDLLSRHLESHQRRVYTATSRIDTSAPVSMLKCTKVKCRRVHGRPHTKSETSTHRHGSSQWPRSCLNSTFRDCTAPTSLLGTLSQRCESDAGFASMTEASSLEGLHITDEPENSYPAAVSNVTNPQMATCVNGSRMQTTNASSEAHSSAVYTTNDERMLHLSPKRRLQYEHLLDTSDECSKEEAWQHYHTKTGRLTGYRNQVPRHSPHRPGCEPRRSPPWKPAFSPNSFHSDSSSQCLGSSKQHTTERKYKNKYHKSKMAQSNGCSSRKVKVTDHEFTSYIACGAAADQPPCEVLTCSVATDERNTVCQEGDPRVSANVPATDSRGPVNSKQGLVVLMNDSAVNPSTSLFQPQNGGTEVSQQCRHIGREVLAEADKWSRHTRFTMKRSQELKASVEASTKEAAYLDFVKGVTKDILSRGVLSDSAMALVFSAHVQRCRHHLREDIIQDKIESLKRDLGITSSDSDHTH